jgi:hypothetical protein
MNIKTQHEWKLLQKRKEKKRKERFSSCRSGPSDPKRGGEPRQEDGKGAFLRSRGGRGSTVEETTSHRIEQKRKISK